MRGAADADKEPLDLIEIAAELAKEHGIKPWELPELDRWYIAFVLFARRDKYGQLLVRSKPREGGQKLSARDAWIKSAELRWGYPTWYAARQYDAMMAEKKASREKSRAKMVAKMAKPIIVSAMPKRGIRGR